MKKTRKYNICVRDDEDRHRIGCQSTCPVQVPPSCSSTTLESIPRLSMSRRCLQRNSFQRTSPFAWIRNRMSLFPRVLAVPVGATVEFNNRDGFDRDVCAPDRETYNSGRWV